jgi:hypothetical protein
VNSKAGKNVLPPPPEAPPPAAPTIPQGKPIAVQIDIETYEQLMAVLQEMPYKLVGQVMNKLAPGVKAIFETPPEPVDPDGEGSAE